MDYRESAGNCKSCNSYLFDYGISSGDISQGANPAIPFILRILMSGNSVLAITGVFVIENDSARMRVIHTTYNTIIF